MRITGALILALLAASAWTQQRRQQDVDLQAAIRQETIDGDLNGAIKAFRAIADKPKTDRAVASAALLHMADCYRKLGDAEARKIYERVLQEYADQTDAVAQAQAHLGGAASHRGGRLEVRQVWKTNGTEEAFGHKLSRDGRYLGYTNWETGDLELRILPTGAMRNLTNTGGWEASGDYATSSVISPDGKHIAYAWQVNGPPTHNEVRILPIEGGKPRVLRRGEETTDYIDVTDWSPDGSGLLVNRTLPDGTTQLALMRVKDGSLQPLKSFKWQSINASFSPDGRYIAYDLPTEGKTQGRDIFVLATDGSRESAAVRDASDDFAPLWTPDGSRLLFLSDRTGNVSLWSLAIEDGKSSASPELVKSDVGQVYPLGVTAGGQFYYEASGGSRTNIYLAQTAPDGKITGPAKLITERFVGANVGPALSPDGERLAYYSVRPTSTVLVIRTMKTGEERELPLGKGLIRPFGSGPKWFADGKSMLVLSRETTHPGFSFYRVDLQTGQMEYLHNAKQFGFQGYSLSPDGKAIFYTEGLDDRPQITTRLIRFDIASRETKEIASNQWMIAPTVSPDGKQVAFVISDLPNSSSALAVIPLNGGKQREVFRGSPWNDGSRYNALSWTPDGHYLIFVRGGVGSKAVNTLWRVPAAGGEPEALGYSNPNRIKLPQFLPEGRGVVFGLLESGPNELWVIDNFLAATTAKK